MTEKTMTIGTPLKTHGGKTYLAKRIVGLMSPHTHYVEPYAGGLSVLLAKDPEGVSEVVNDLDGRLMDFWRCLQDPQRFERLRRRLRATPFSQVEWEGAEGVEDAAAFFIRCRQSLAGRGDTFAPLSKRRVRRGMNEQASAWLSVIEGLPKVHARLSRIAILNGPALDVIRKEDTAETLFYLDPPYPASTRTAPDVYEFEMSDDEHRALLDLIQTVEGKVIISGYACPLYDEALSRWWHEDFNLPNNAASGRQKRRMVERIWTNYTP